MSSRLSKPTLSSIAAVICLTLASCGGHEVNQWKRPGSGSTGKSLQPVAVFAAVYSAPLRKEYEDAIVAALAARGISAKPTYPVVTVAQVKADRRGSQYRRRLGHRFAARQLQPMKTVESLG